MPFSNKDIRLLSAPSILGLKPNGVELLSETLLKEGLAAKLNTLLPILHVPTLNDQYNPQRDAATLCLNPQALHDFSLTLGRHVAATVAGKNFPFVLGGDCSVLLGIMPGLKSIGHYGLVFIDAHADFYSPEKSPTGEVADMDLAIVTGHGPALLTGIGGEGPYVREKDVIHVAQRDAEEAAKFGSPDIRETDIRCFDMQAITEQGIRTVTNRVLDIISNSEVDAYWIHFDTDSLADDLNPAVEYHLAGGLQFDEAEYLLSRLLQSGKMAGISVTIYNPNLDEDGSIGRNITASLGRAFSHQRM